MEWLGDTSPGFEVDLTVEEVARLFSKASGTVTAWIRAGKLEAYQFQGREYRITRDAVEQFQARQRGWGLRVEDAA